MTTREAIQMIVSDSLKSDRVRVASVVSVEDDKTCTVMTDTETEIPGVRLQVDDASGVYLVPSVGSNVIMVRVSDFDFAVFMYSQIDSIEFLDGTFGGLVKVIDLTSKLNALENKVNDLITYINGHTHASNGTPPSPLFTGGTLTPTTRSDIENEKITHGTV